MGPPGEEYSSARGLANNVSQTAEKLRQVLRQTFVQGVNTDENFG